MEKTLKITLKGSRKAIERAERAIEDLLMRNTHPQWRGWLENYKIEIVEDEMTKHHQKRGD